MLIKGITDEDFINYKFPSLFIATNTCTFKCDKECGRTVCQNSRLVKQPSIEVSMISLLDRYRNNPITKAVVFGGLEPLDDGDTIVMIGLLRSMGIMDDVVIYTGYNKEEIIDKIEVLKQYKNVVVKYGRYIPNMEPHLDPVLGVKLASDNQYAERIS